MWLGSGNFALNTFDRIGEGGESIDPTDFLLYSFHPKHVSYL